jgi:hypothetical protein
MARHSTAKTTTATIAIIAMASVVVSGMGSVRLKMSAFAD